MADELITINVVFKAGPGQLKNPEQSYEIAPTELSRLGSDWKSTSTTGGSYDVSRADPNASGPIKTKLIVRFSEVLYIG